MYTHERQDWPQLTWNRERLAEPLAAIRHRQGRLIGYMGALGFKLRQEAVLETLAADVLKSSEIEGEHLDPEQVRSSIARRLGIDIGALKPADRNVEGVVEMMLDATGALQRTGYSRKVVFLARVASPYRSQQHDQNHHRCVA
jgi:Fic family protein